MINQLSFCLFVISIFHFVLCSNHVGPDPWDYIPSVPSVDNGIPSDLKEPFKKKIGLGSNLGNGEWFFKRTLAILLNSGQTKKNEDGSVDVSVQLKLDQEKWNVLNEYTKSNVPLTEDMYRRSVAYIEEALYRPSLAQKVVLAWTEYLQQFLVEYKDHITWSFGFIAVLGLLLWVWKHISHRHVVLFVTVVLYCYEVFISYKEAEKQELVKFLAAVNKCSWFFWKSSCEVPSPDPIVFLKHMNPLKIGISMFTNLLSEPMLVMSATVNTMIHGVTDDLWFPFDIILHSILIISINIMLIALLIMIIFNFILNIPFNLNIGLIKIGIKERNRTLNFSKEVNKSLPVETSDRISNATLDKILDVCSLALNKNPNNVISTNINALPKLKKSSSTGRLPNVTSEKYFIPKLEDITVRKRNKPTFMIGGGDSIQLKSKK